MRFTPGAQVLHCYHRLLSYCVNKPYWNLYLQKKDVTEEEQDENTHASTDEGLQEETVANNVTHALDELEEENDAAKEVSEDDEEQESVILCFVYLL